MLQSTISKVALCAAGGAVAAMTAAGPATAAPTLPDGGGKVHKGFTKKRTDVHKWPSFRAPVISHIQAHRHIFIKCKVRKHGDTWYKLAMQRGWVNSRTVHVRSHVPHCTWIPRMHDSGMRDSGMNDSFTNDAGMEDASLYPAQVGRTAGEPLG